MKKLIQTLAMVMALTGAVVAAHCDESSTEKLSNDARLSFPMEYKPVFELMDKVQDPTITYGQARELILSQRPLLRKYFFNAALLSNDCVLKHRRIIEDELTRLSGVIALEEEKPEEQRYSEFNYLCRIKKYIGNIMLWASEPLQEITNDQLKTFENFILTDKTDIKIYSRFVRSMSDAKCVTDFFSGLSRPEPFFSQAVISQNMHKLLFVLCSGGLSSELIQMVTGFGVNRKDLGGYVCGGHWVDVDRDKDMSFRDVYDRVKKHSTEFTPFLCGSKIFDYASAVIPFIDFE
ncbi:MAG: hypothetical protein NTX76_03125 [Alphaproteobacteria bacterium]|nr:hypothetical protein [Alphaproteobacteria bacterium]